VKLKEARPYRRCQNYDKSLSRFIQFWQTKRSSLLKYQQQTNKKGCLALLLFLSLLALLFTLSQKKITWAGIDRIHIFFQKSFGFGQILRYFGRSLYMGVACCYARPPMKILHEKIIAWREKEDYE